MSGDARKLPTHHLTIRVPWHDGRWMGSVCANPLDNSSCLVLPRIGEGRRDAEEADLAGLGFDQLSAQQLPPCVRERATFMAPFDLTLTMRHPYAERNNELYGHFASTPFVQTRYSAACVPFRWMLREAVEGRPKEGEVGLAERLELGWHVEREPKLQFDTDWVQERDNQLALLDTFFSAVQPQESLCFFYAKRTPLSDQARRVIVGVGRVLSVGDHREYEYNLPIERAPLRCVLWERNVGHSIRPGFADGFLLPYHEILTLAAAGKCDPEELVAFAPDEYFDSYSFGSELLTHDGAISSLLAIAAALERIRQHVEGPWVQALAWIDQQLNRIWRARGAFPGLGSALAAFGFQWGFEHGTLLAYEIDLERAAARSRGQDESAWKIADDILLGRRKLPGLAAEHIPPSAREAWQTLSVQRRALLEMLSRADLSETQALRFYDPTIRRDAGIEASDEQLLANPYLLFELDRRSADPITFSINDRGAFPDDAVAARSAVPVGSAVSDPADRRRVRALVADLLEEAAAQGDTLQARDALIRQARRRVLRPPCPLGEDVLATCEPWFEIGRAHV